MPMCPIVAGRVTYICDHTNCYGRKSRAYLGEGTPSEGTVKYQKNRQLSVLGVTRYLCNALCNIITFVVIK